MDTQSAEEYHKSTWQISARLEVSWLRPPAVQYVLLDHDPLPAYRDAVLAAAPAREGDPAARPYQLAVLWDRVFRGVTGDKVNILVDDHAEQRRVDESGKVEVLYTRTYFAVSSNAPSGPRWLVTKAVVRDGRVYAWCLPVQARTGGQESAVLTGDNALDLGAIAGDPPGSATPTP